MLTFASLPNVDGSETFNKIKGVLKALDLENITEDELNKALDDNNICR